MFLGVQDAQGALINLAQGALINLEGNRATEAGKQPMHGAAKDRGSGVSSIDDIRGRAPPTRPRVGPSLRPDVLSIARLSWCRANGR